MHGGSSGQDPSRPPSNQQYTQAPSAPAPYQPTQPQYQGGPPTQYQGGPPTQYQGSGANQYQGGPPTNQYGQPPPQQQYSQSGPSHYNPPPPSNYQAPHSGQQVQSASHQGAPHGRQTPSNGYPALPNGNQGPPNNYQTQQTGYQQTSTHQQQAPPSGYQAPPNAYPGTTNSHQAPSNGLLMVSTDNQMNNVPPTNYQQQYDGHQNQSRGNTVPPNGYQAPPLPQKVQPAFYNGSPNDHQGHGNRSHHSTDYQAPSHGQQSGFQQGGGYPQQSGFGQGGAANTSGQYTQPMQQQQQSQHRPLPAFGERRSPPGEPRQQQYTGFPQPPQDSHYQASRGEERQAESRPNRNLLNNGGATQQYPRERGFGRGGGGQPPMQQQPHYDGERERGFGNGLGGGRQQNRMGNGQRNDQYRGGQHDISDEEDEQLYRTDDDVQPTIREGRGGRTRQYDGMPLGDPVPPPSRPTQSRSSSPDYWAMADEFPRGSKEWLRLSIMTILNQYSTVQPSERDTKIVTVEHLTKLLRSYDSGKMIDRGNYPEDLIAGAMGYQNDVTWLDFLREMRNDGLLKMYEMNVTARRDFAIYAPFVTQITPFASQRPFMD